MFGIGGGEIILILMVVLMLFGSDKIPEIARTLGKLMAQLKNATNDIKHEIQKSVDNIESEANLKEITHEISKAKEGFANNSLETVTKIKDDFEEITGSIKFLSSLLFRPFINRSIPSIGVFLFCSNELLTRYNNDFP